MLRNILRLYNILADYIIIGIGRVYIRSNKMKTSLLIMAAGIGSRFGGGIKQLAPVGPNGEIIMDYSIHDAIEAGFDKIVFVIRNDIEDDFREIIGNRIEKICADNWNILSGKLEGEADQDEF